MYGSNFLGTIPQATWRGSTLVMNAPGVGTDMRANDPGSGEQKLEKLSIPALFKKIPYMNDLNSITAFYITHYHECPGGVVGFPRMTWGWGPILGE